MKKLYIMTVLACLMLSAGCNKFLDIQPKGRQLLVTVKDYDLWLNSSDLTYEANAYILYGFTDLYDEYPYTLSSTAAGDLEYRWAPQFNDAATTPQIWSGFYATIYYYNAVINGIDGATDGTTAQKQSLKAEALLGRAYEYLYLVNLYGKVYNPATAAQDLGVPFVESTDIVTKTPPRSTVKQIYDRIIADLNQAVLYLPADNSTNRFRGSVPAAYSMLARTYFYMGDYANAQKNAALALNAPSVGMLDYNTGITSPTNYPNLPLLAVRKDVIYARAAGNTQVYAAVPVALSFISSFAPGDLRLNFIKDISGPTLSSTPKRGSEYYFFAYPTSAGATGYAANANLGPSVAEMKLIIAESAARTGDLTTALKQLDDVDKNRFLLSTYKQFTSTDKETVLKKILAERVFEFPFSGLRWLDMRRLDAEGRMPVVNRYDNNNNIFATLNPGDPRYTLQIPLNILSYNPDMPQNP